MTPPETHTSLKFSEYWHIMQITKNYTPDGFWENWWKRLNGGYSDNAGLTQVSEMLQRMGAEDREKWIDEVLTCDAHRTLFEDSFFGIGGLH